MVRSSPSTSYAIKFVHSSIGYEEPYAALLVLLPLILTILFVHIIGIGGMDWQERKRNKQKIQMKEVKRKHNASSQHSQLSHSQCLTVAHSCLNECSRKKKEEYWVLLLETEHKTQNYRKNGNYTQINVIIFHGSSAQLRSHSIHIRAMMSCLCILHSTNSMLMRLVNNDEENCLN